MGLSEVKKEILDSAASQIKSIESDAKNQIKKIKDDAAESVKTRKVEIEQSTNTETTRLREINLADAKAQNTNIVLNTKRELVNEVIIKAKAKLKKKQKDYVKKLCKKAESELNVNKIYCKKEFAGDLSFETVATDIDGIIAENKDGDISIDYSFDTLLPQIRDANLKEITEVLLK